MAETSLGGISVTVKAEVDASGVVTGTSQIDNAVKGTAAQLKQAETQVNTFSGRVKSGFSAVADKARALRSSFRVQKGAAAQLGMQLQDVAVMAQYGADKFVILGQQGSQIASLFGPGGALFGAVIAVASAIGGVLVNSINTAKDAAKELPSELAVRLQEIKSRFDEVDDASKAAFSQVELGKLNTEYDQLSQKIAKLEENTSQQSNTFNTLGVEAASAAGKINTLKQEQAELAQLIERVSRLSVEGLAGETLDLNFESNDAGIQSRLDSIRAGIENEREMYETWRQTRAAITAGIISDEQAQLIQADVAAQQRINANRDSLIERLEAERKLVLDDQLMTAEEKAKRQAEIDAAILEADRLHKEQLKKQGIEYAQATANAEEKIERQKFAAITSMRNAALQNLMGLFDVFAGENKAAAIAAIAINKGLALAQNTQNTLAAQTRALAELGPIAGPPAAAKIGSYGAINGALIAATGLAQAAGLGSSRGGPQFSGGVPAYGAANQSAASGQSLPDQNISINLVGGQIYTADQIRGLIGAINEQTGDGVRLSTSG